MSYAVFFGVLSAACLVGALAALWGSLRAAFGGAGGGTIASAADAPERATLLDEKASLLRAIKDLQYEHQVGKLDRADFERLDRAYRARAKEVLELLDRDVRPYRARAEELLASVAPVGGDASTASSAGGGSSKHKAKKKGAAAKAGKAAPSGEALVGKLDALSPEMRAAAEAFLAKLAEEAGAASAPDEGDEGDGGGEAEPEAAAPPASASAPGPSADDEPDEGDDARDEDDGDGDDRRGKAGA